MKKYKINLCTYITPTPHHLSLSLIHIYHIVINTHLSYMIIYYGNILYNKCEERYIKS